MASRTALVSYKAASDALGKAATFGVVVIAARRLSTDAFGLFSLAATFGWILAVATDAGLQLHLARAIAHAPEAVGRILPPILRLRGALAAGAGVLTTCAALILLPVRDAVAVVAIVCASLASSLVELLNYAYRAIDRSDLESTLNLIQRLGTVGLVFALLSISPDLTWLAAAMLLPPVVVLAWSLRLSGQLGAAGGGFDLSARVPAGTLRGDVLPIGAGIVLSALYFRVDLFLLEYWRGVADVAHYNAVFRLVDAMRLLPAAVLAVLLPSVMRRRDAGFVVKLSAGLFLLGLAGAVAGRLLASSLVTLAYGASYAPAVPILQVLLLALPLLSLNYGLSHQVIGWGWQRAYAFVCGGALVVNLAATAWLIPADGATGAAWATFATELFLTLALLAVIVSARARTPNALVPTP